MNKVEKILEELVFLRTDKEYGSNVACVDYICNILHDNQIVFERLANTNGKIENVIAGINVATLKDIAGGLLLSGHIDTVGVNEQDWDFNPFKLTYQSGKLYGRGTADMKYFVATVLSLLPQLKAVSYPIILCFSGDEETEVLGVRQIIKFMRDRNIHPQYALVGEPTHFDVCTAHNGYCGFTTTIKGKGCHSSRPDLGSNAIYAATKIIAEIEKLNSQYQPFGTTLNVGKIKGGIGRNSVAEECSFDWDIRYVSQKHRLEILQKIEEFCGALKKQNEVLKIVVETAEELPAFEKVSDSSFENKLISFSGGKDIRLPFATEAGFFQQYGIETLICGAPRTEILHTANEYIAADDLLKYSDFLIRFIKGFSL